jgi:predicted PurR-regulated permease PerM
MPAISHFVKGVIQVLSPILYGLLMAYLMNPLVDFFEKHLRSLWQIKNTSNLKTIRALSIGLVYVCVLGTVFLSIRFLVPQILENIKSIAISIPSHMETLRIFLVNLNDTVNSNLSSFPFELSIDLNKIIYYINNASWFSFNSLNTIFDSVFSHTLNITSTLLDLLIGLVIAMYALTQKETFVNGSRRMAYAVFSKSNATKLINLFSETHSMITKFVVGKSLDSLIIGILCYVGLLIMKNPYALLLALIIGITNMIPYFGPILGGVPAVIITLFTGFWPAVAVAIFVLILQQFDGLILGPKILGDSIGLRPFWIISAITIGGAIWGPLGMFFASPILAVILLVFNRWIDRRLALKDIYLPQITFEESLNQSLKENKN